MYIIYIYIILVNMICNTTLSRLASDAHRPGDF